VVFAKGVFIDDPISVLEYMKTILSGKILTMFGFSVYSSMPPGYDD
jgi:hypothetical protein